MKPAITTEGLTKDYDGFRALDSLSIEVFPGEIYGFLGPNGAGITTAIRLFLDLIRPTVGKATILGFDSRRQSHEVRAQTAYLPGDLRLYNGKTGRETIEFFAGLRNKPADWNLVLSLSDTLSLDLAKDAGALSKGNRQKLGIILALFSRPTIYLLDEPTSGLDPITQRLVWDLLREEANRGATIFFSSHVMSEVEHVCERVTILRSGTVVATEPIATLKSKGIRRLELTFAERVSANAFEIVGVRELDRTGHTVTLEVSENLDKVIKAAAEYQTIDLRTEQASLDEILLSYFQESRL